MAEPKISSFKTMCFTLNNPTNEEQAQIMTFFESDRIKRAVFQLEQGESETPHFQGYFAVETPMQFKTLKALDGFTRCHFEKAKGDAKSNLRYCTKDEGRLDGPWIYPNIEAFPKIGERNDLKKLMSDIKSGLTIDEIADKYPGEYLRMKKSITEEVNKQILLKRPLIYKPLHVTYMYGDSDTNKSRYAREMAQEDYEDPEIFIHNLPAAGTVWWDGYTSQKCVIINEFNGQLDLQTFNKLLDGEINLLQVKGSHVVSHLERLYITSNFSWDELWAKTYAKNPTLAKAVYRRLDEIIKFETDQDPKYEKYCPKRVDDGIRLPSIDKPLMYTGESMPTIDFVSKYKNKKRKLNELETDNVIDIDGSVMSASYASNPANFRKTKKRKTQEDDREDDE